MGTIVKFTGTNVRSTSSTLAAAEITRDIKRLSDELIGRVGSLETARELETIAASIRDRCGDDRV